jgi:hypothetical protein
MAVDRLPNVEERHLAGPWGAILGGGVAAAAAFLIPLELIENAAALAGLGDIGPAVAPPLGWTAQAGVAFVAGTAGAALGWLCASKISLGEWTMTIAWPQSLNRDHPLRAARGTEMDAADWPRKGRRRSAKLEGLRKASPFSRLGSWLRARRDEEIIDFIPRQPLMASRDLPPPDVASEFDQGLAIQERIAALPLPSMSWRDTGVKDTTGKKRPRPLPRSPEPFSEEQLEALRRLLEAARGVQAETASARSQVEVAREEAALLSEPETYENATQDEVLDLADFERFEDMPLGSMLDHFEQQVERRIAVDESRDATARIETVLPHLAEPMAEALSDEPGNDVMLEPQVDAALRTALDTLRKLSEGTRKKR